MNMEGMTGDILGTNIRSEIRKEAEKDYFEEKSKELPIEDKKILEKEEAFHYEQISDDLSFQDVCPESRSKEKIMSDIHEAQCKYDYHSRRCAALLSDDSIQYMALGEHQRAAKSWQYRLENLQKELRNCS